MSRARGMTLLEVLVAMSILAVIVVVLGAGLRVGLRAWEAGESRAAVQQEVRAVVELVTEALASAHDYKGRLGENPNRVVLFEGEPEEVRFVTTAPPLALNAPAAPFHAVRLGLAKETELRVVERLVPAAELFGDGDTGDSIVLSRAVTALRFQYQDDKGAWLDTWDGPTAAAIPAAVRVELSLRQRGRSTSMPPLVVPLALGRKGT